MEDTPYGVQIVSKRVVGFLSLIQNDTDVENDQLSAQVVGQPSHGTVNVYPNGGFYYVPALNYFGPDSFTYKVSYRNFFELY